MTTKADPLVNARNLPSGARFYKCALQVNPHHYSGTFRGQPAPGDAATYAREMVSRAAASGISVLAVTDHNDVSGVALIREAAKEHGIHVFPGFEVETSDGVHVLCIYPLDTEESALGRYLGQAGILDRGPSTDQSTQSFTDLLRCVRDQGGVTIAAHATNPGGLLNVLRGQTRIRAWQDENLLAIQIPGPVEDLPQEFRGIVENQDPAYRRAHGVGKRLAVAVVNAEDVKAPDDLDHLSATCWLKMSEVGVGNCSRIY